MEVPATVTSKGQVTIPAKVRKALGLSAGDRVIFQVTDDTVILRSESDPCAEAKMKRVPDFFALAGSVPTPPDVVPNDWRAQRAAAWEAVARRER